MSYDLLCMTRFLAVLNLVQEVGQQDTWRSKGRIALYPGFTDGGRTPGSFAHAQNFPRNMENRVTLVFFCIRIMYNRVFLVFFRVMATCSDSDNEFSSALVLRIIYTSEGYSD